MLKSSVNTILRKYYEARKYIDINLQKILLLTTAVKLIKTEFKLINTNPKFYTFLKNLEQSTTPCFFPFSLHLFLHDIIVPGNEQKLAAIGLSIMQAARPRKILSPL